MAFCGDEEGIGSRRSPPPGDPADLGRQLVDAVTEALQGKVTELVEPIVRQAVADFEAALRRELAVTVIGLIVNALMR